MHAVHRLFKYRKSLSTTVYKARGQRVKRCELCRLSLSHCICHLTPKAVSNAGFLLLMYDTEVMKPSNTGRLIADLIPDTFAFLWSRTVPNLALLDVIKDKQWQPFVVFPEQYVDSERQVVTEKVICHPDKRPLFIMLDGSWREARKMFRKSPYLSQLPVVSFTPEKRQGEQISSRYQIRSAANDTQLATAEVAARILDMAGEGDNAQLLDLWFDVFSYQYQKSVCQTNKGDPQAIENLQSFVRQRSSF